MLLACATSALRMSSQLRSRECTRIVLLCVAVRLMMTLVKCAVSQTTGEKVQSCSIVLVRVLIVEQQTMRTSGRASNKDGCLRGRIINVLKRTHAMSAEIAA